MIIDIDMENEETKVTEGRSYYGGTECFDTMRVAFGDAAVYDFCKCNAFKYLWRAEKKHDSPVADLRKAKWYLEKAIDLKSEENG